MSCVYTYAKVPFAFYKVFFTSRYVQYEKKFPHLEEVLRRTKLKAKLKKGIEDASNESW